MANKSKRKSKPRPKAKPKGSPKRRSKPQKKRRRAGQRGRPAAGTPDWTLAFLAAIRDGLHVREAAATANVDGTMPYHRRDEDEAFRAAWEQASKIGTKALEAEAGRRSYHGTTRAVYYMGEECGRIREYSDTLLMFLLRARKPKKYRDRGKLELTGKDDGPVEVKHDAAEVLKALTDLKDAIAAGADQLGRENGVPEDDPGKPVHPGEAPAV
jgi:hypothetical protein